MQKFDSHSGLCALIPTEDKYLSLVTGAFTILVKASVSHSKTVEHLNDALNDIGDAVARCEVEARLIRSRSMQKAIAKLYIVIFLFLGDAIRWYRSSSTSKIVKSLHNDYSEGFRSDVNRIKQMAFDIQHIALLGSAAETRVVRLSVEQLQNQLHDARIGLTGQLRFLAELMLNNQSENAQQHRRTQELLANLKPAEVASMLLEGGQEAFTNDQLIGPGDVLLLGETAASPRVSRRDAHEVDEIAGLQSPEPPPNLRYVIQNLWNARHHDEVWSLQPDMAFASDLHASQLAENLSQWLSYQQRSLLYLEDQTPVSKIRLQAAALQVVRLCHNSNLACVNHWPSPQSSSPVVAREDGSAIVDMMLNVAYQIMALFPGAAPVIDVSDVSAASLTSSLTVHTAARLLERLLGLDLPPDLHVVIDAASAFTDASTADISCFFSAIRAHRGSTCGAPFKILMMSHIRIAGLLSVLEHDEISIIQPMPPRVTPTLSPIVRRALS